MITLVGLYLQEKKENSLGGVCIRRKIVEVGRKKMENYSFLFSDL